MLLLVDEVTVSKNSAFANTSGAASPDATLLDLIDKLGLAKYSRVFIEQEVIVLFSVCEN